MTHRQNPKMKSMISFILNEYSSQQSKFDERLQKIKGISEMNRLPRPLEEFAKYKSLELIHLLIFYESPVFQDLIGDSHVRNFNRPAYIQ